MSDLVPVEHSLAAELAVVQGDLNKLNSQQRLAYYGRVCESVGLNPYTQPFDYIVLNSKLTLYARKNATDQIRAAKGVSVRIVSKEISDDVYIVHVEAVMPNGRRDEDLGIVPLGQLKGEMKANAIMKAISKAKRRVTLSICGLGFLDETEVQDIPGARYVTADMETHEIVGEAQEQTETADDLLPRKMTAMREWAKRKYNGEALKSVLSRDLNAPGTYTDRDGKECKGSAVCMTFRGLTEAELVTVENALKATAPKAEEPAEEEFPVDGETDEAAQ